MATQYTQRTYAQSTASKRREEELARQEAAGPGDYESRWQEQLEAALQSILSRPAFSYDSSLDPLYQQYRDDYVNQGRMAMMDTMAQASALSGGYGNSYAQLAGQQAYQSHLQGLGDILPTLYQLALDTYDRQGNQLLTNYNLLSEQDATDYGRYRDSHSDWADQRNYLADRYDAERGFDYTQYRDMVSDDQWMAAFDEDIRRYDLAHQPKVSSGGGSSKSYSGGSSSSTKKKKEEEKKENKNTAAIYKLPVSTSASKKTGTTGLLKL